MSIYQRSRFPRHISYSSGRSGWSHPASKGVGWVNGNSRPGHSTAWTPKSILGPNLPKSANTSIDARSAPTGTLLRRPHHRIVYNGIVGLSVVPRESQASASHADEPMTSIKQAFEALLGGLNPSRDRLAVARTVSTVGIILGISITLSALVFPRYPARVFGLLLGDYTDVLSLLVVSEQLFSLILGVLILVGASTSHFLLDIRMGTLGAFWEFSGDAFVRLLVLLSFSISFATARILVVLSGIVGPESGGTAWVVPVNEVWVRGYHVHHFFFGFLFLTIAGWLSLFSSYSRSKIAVLYGVGLGIFVDEFGMLLTEGDYFATSSYFIAVVFTSLVLAGLYWDRLSEIHSVELED